jgi:hypothetical protein
LDTSLFMSVGSGRLTKGVAELNLNESG